MLLCENSLSLIGQPPTILNGDRCVYVTEKQYYLQDNICPMDDCTGVISDCLGRQYEIFQRPLDIVKVKRQLVKQILRKHFSKWSFSVEVICLSGLSGYL